MLDEDKGLWAAIETFIDSTKRPIVLTTSDVTFSGQFVYTLEENIIKAPSSVQSHSTLRCPTKCCQLDYRTLCYHNVVRSL